MKQDSSFQTKADRIAEGTILSVVQAAFPEHEIVSEECGIISPAKKISTPPYQWRVDPLDGTENFLMGIPSFSSSVAFCDEKTALVAAVSHPMTQDSFTAVRGQGAWLNGECLHVSRTRQLQACRVFFIPDFVTKRQAPALRLRHHLHWHCWRVLDTWSPALDWCLVASGKADAVVTLASQPILSDAGLLILEEAGGCITDFQGRPFTGENQRWLVGSNGTDLHQQLLLLAERLHGEGDP